MKKRIAKKKQSEKYEVYRGIRLWQGWAGNYSYLQNKDQKVMILFPSIESYAPNFTKARKTIDAWYLTSEAAKYRHDRKHNLGLGF